MLWICKNTWRSITLDWELCYKWGLQCQYGAKTQCIYLKTKVQIILAKLNVRLFRMENTWLWGWHWGDVTEVTGVTSVLKDNYQNFRTYCIGILLDIHVPSWKISIILRKIERINHFEITEIINLNKLLYNYHETGNSSNFLSIIATVVTRSNVLTYEA